MLQTRTPLRVSLLGGGSDYPGMFQKMGGGATLCTAIDKYVWCAVRKLPPFFEHKTRVVWSEIELVQDNTEIKNPVVREVLRYLGIKDGLEIHYQGDLPARSGVGSSSAFTVGLLHALYALYGDSFIVPELLAEDAIKVERDYIMDEVGFQDQIICAVGGLRFIRINEHGETVYVRLGHGLRDRGRSRMKDLENHLMLFYTGQSRISSDIAKEQVSRAGDKLDCYKRMVQMAELGREIFEDETKDIAGIGELIEEAWQIKRTLSPVISNAYIDEMHDAFIRQGAIGVKLIGAGQSGFFLVFVRPELREKMRDTFRLLEVPFAFSQEGSKIVFSQGD